MEKKQTLLKQLNIVEKQEKKFLEHKENAFIKTNLKPVMNMIENKIPEKFTSTLNAAFYKGFQFVFQKGSAYIEKTYNKDKLELEHDLNNYALDKHSSKRHIKNMDKQSNLSNTWNQSIALLEGGILGLLGIGLPDIPLFISVIIRTIQEFALTYGYSYDITEEKAYILYIICGAMTKEETQREYDIKIDLLGKNIDSMKYEELDLDHITKEASFVLSNTLLTAKVIQGLPVIGVVGGIINPTIINKIGKYAKLKYKKRYIHKKLMEV